MIQYLRMQHQYIHAASVNQQGPSGVAAAGGLNVQQQCVQDSVPSSHQQELIHSQPSSNPIHVQKLQRSLDLNPFLNQLEGLMSSSIKVPADISLVGNRPHNVFSVKGIWDSDEDRKRDVSSFYNFNSIKKRKWLKTILLEESDSESDGEQCINEEDLKALLKIHRCRRKYQKQYHADILNSQYTYYGAGLLSDQDKFPEHQKFVQEQYGFVIPTESLTEAPGGAAVDSVDAKIQEVVSDVVDSVFPHDNRNTSVVECPDHIVASVVDSAHQDAQPSSTVAKKKRSNVSKNFAVTTSATTQIKDSGCVATSNFVPFRSFPCVDNLSANSKSFGNKQ